MIGYIKSRIGLHHATLAEVVGKADRERLATILRELQAVPSGTTGAPAGELDVRYYTVGSEGFRICASDDLSLKLWGSKRIVSEISKRMTERNNE